MHGHAAHDDLDALLPESSDRLAQTVVLVRVIAVEETYLHDRHVERIRFRVEGDGEGGEDAVVEAAADGLGVDACASEARDDF